MQITNDMVERALTAYFGPMDSIGNILTDRVPVGAATEMMRAALSAALSQGGGGEEWVSVKEPPKFRDSVWCATRREGTPTVIEGRHDHHGWWLIHDGCAYSFSEYGYEEPTHWQQIAVPKPPAQADGGGKP